MLEGRNGARTGVPPGMPRGAMCVQRFDDSLNSAIHITYRISLRSSSMPEPRDPLLKVLFYFASAQTTIFKEIFLRVFRRGSPRRSKVKKPQGARKGREAPLGKKGPHSVMILPQVHLKGKVSTLFNNYGLWGGVRWKASTYLRKPCYDFYFL